MEKMKELALGYARACYEQDSRVAMLLGGKLGSVPFCEQVCGGTIEREMQAAGAKDPAFAAALCLAAYRGTVVREGDA